MKCLKKTDVLCKVVLMFVGACSSTLMLCLKHADNECNLRWGFDNQSASEPNTTAKHAINQHAVE